MSNASRKCPYCDNFNRVDDLDSFLDTNRNRLFCNRREWLEYGMRGSLKSQEKKAIKEFNRIQRVAKKKIRDEVKGIKHWRKVTQTVVNKWVLVRDKHLPCISCGIQNHEISSNGLTGSEWHAGHFRSVGSAPEMRYYTLNIHKQCSTCNKHLSGNRAGYEHGLIARYGQDFLDNLLKERPPRNDTIETLAKMRRIISKKTRLKQKLIKS